MQINNVNVIVNEIDSITWYNNKVELHIDSVTIVKEFSNTEDAKKFFLKYNKESK